MELIKGTLDLLILRTLAWQPMHGYGVSEWIRERTDGVLSVQDAALYQALRRLESQELVSAAWGLSENNRRARYYTLTAAGRKQLAAERAEFERVVAAMRMVLDFA
jgi:PadR family transcriptional regulator, regulatory protein PadR